VSGEKSTTKLWQGGLGIRFLAIVILALLPVSALSMWQGVERIRLDQESVRQTLRQSALAAASVEMNIFIAAEQLLQTLAKDDDIRLGKKGCQRRLEDSGRGMATFGNLVRVSSEGVILCAAFLPPSTLDVTKLPWWSAALTRREFFVDGPYFSDALRKNVFAGVLPIVGADGAFDGTLNVAINIDWLTFSNERQRRLPRGSVVALIDTSGTIVASNAPAIAATVFAGATGLVEGSDGRRAARGPNDEAWSLAIAPVLRHDYYVGFAMRDNDLSRLSYFYVVVDLLLPVLTIVFASLAIWWGTNRHILRWIDTLRGMAVAYAGGNYALRPQVLNTAPREFRELGDMFSEMALAVDERDRGLKGALGQKDLLIKEIHHRVKNTLQIVMSLLRLQSNRLSDPATREVLEQASARINALALAHRAVYDVDHHGSIDLKPLLSDAVQQVQRAHDGSHTNLTVNVDIAPCLVSSDAAIPLLLFVNEALTNAYKHGYPEPDTGGHVSVSLKPACNGRMDLTIANDGVAFVAEPDQRDAGIGVGLMKALARQVSGEVSMQSSGENGTVVTLNFPVIAQTAA
jgi:two-component sensor histidine kinase